MSYLARVTLLYLLPFLCSSSPGDSCQHPEGVNGDTYIEGCVKHTCKKGVWRPSIDKSTCCFNGEAFEFGSRISTVDDECTTAYLECTNNGIETVISISPHCSPAKKIQVNEIKDLLKQHILAADDSDCSNSSSIIQEEKEALQCSQPYTTLSDDWRQVSLSGLALKDKFCDYKYNGWTKYGEWTEFKAGWYTFSFPSYPYATLPNTPSGKCGTWAMSWSGNTLPMLGDPVKDINIQWAEHTPNDYSTTGKVVACRVAGTNSVRYLYYLLDVSGDYCGAYCAI